jgi:hypothetical protein
VRREQGVDIINRQIGPHDLERLNLIKDTGAFRVVPVLRHFLRGLAVDVDADDIPAGRSPVKGALRLIQVSGAAPA